MCDSQLRSLHLVQETCPPVQEGGEERGGRGREREGGGGGGKRREVERGGRMGVEGRGRGNKGDESGKGNRDK